MGRWLSLVPSGRDACDLGRSRACIYSCRFAPERKSIACFGLIATALFATACDSTQLSPREPPERREPPLQRSAGPSGRYDGPPPRSAVRSRQSRGYTYAQNPYQQSPSERSSAPQGPYGAPAPQGRGRSVREADYEAQEALRRAQFEVDRAFDIANEYARRWAGEELDLARRNAQESLKAAQDNAARAMQEAARRASEYEGGGEARGGGETRDEGRDPRNAAVDREGRGTDESPQVPPPDWQNNPEETGAPPADPVPPQEDGGAG